MLKVLKDNPTSYKGRCLCKKVSYQLSQNEFEPLAHCYCSMCRKFHGTVFAALLTVDRGKLEFVTGSEYLKAFACESQGRITARTFCSECGSSSLFESKHNLESHTVELAIATLDEPIEIFVDGHIYTQDKANWHDINDSLPKYASYRKSELT